LNYEHNLPDEEKLFETVIDTKRVAKVVKGGRNFSFSAIVVVGDRAGKIGVGDGKANEIADAIRKAKEKATKSMFTVPIIKGTIPHEIMSRFGASRVMMKPGRDPKHPLQIPGLEHPLQRGESHCQRAQVHAHPERHCPPAQQIYG